MKNIDSLIEKAAELKAEGLVEGQIAEELNISRGSRGPKTSPSTGAPLGRAP